jgi:hypothetical protein
MTTRFLGSFSRVGAETAEALALIVLHFGAKNGNSKAS